MADTDIKTARARRLAALRQALQERILVLDGAMGTAIQGYKLEEADYRGSRFADWGQDVKGNNDLLVLSQPDIIREITEAYFEAGADLASSNSFNGTRISQADYGMQDLAPEISYASARLAREAADAVTARHPERPRWVVGALGPTNRTASVSPDVNNPGFRNTSFDELADAYEESARALWEGGADLLLVETIFDTLNAKAALFGIERLRADAGEEVPVMISGTITDMSGRNLSGQTPEALWYSVRHARPFSMGMNCSFGAEQLRPAVAELARIADVPIAAYPNAGLPNELGEYDESPEATAAFLRGWAEEGLVNMVGGCCGTTPEHIHAIAEAVAGLKPRPVPEVPRAMRLAGMEPFSLAS